jgi:superfamily I DNA/RNA helicase
MLECAEALGTTFDAIVVDEGQDFEPEWWDILALLLQDPDHGPYYVFADPKQGIYATSWNPPFAATEMDLTINCRNTLEIGELVAAVYGDESLTRGVSGPPPELHIVSDFKAIGPCLRRTMHRLLVEERLEPSSIVVLADSKQLVAFLHKNALGPHRFVPPPERNGIVTETIHRFKGLESESVVLILTEQHEDQQPLIYVGHSRARAHLEVIATELASAELPSNFVVRPL